jgi:hypothetical protein
MEGQGGEAQGVADPKKLTSFASAAITFRETASEAASEVAAGLVTGSLIWRTKGDLVLKLKVSYDQSLLQGEKVGIQLIF